MNVRRSPAIGCSGARCSRLYLIWYGLGRSCIESIRVDPSEIFFGIRTNVWAAFAAIAVGLVIIVVQTAPPPGAGAQPVPSGARVAAGDCCTL